jgi:hypothetical protein
VAPPAPAATAPVVAGATVARTDPAAPAALSTRPVAASRRDAVGGVVHHDPGGLHGQALAALLAFAGLLALGTFLRRFRPPVT